MRHCSEERCSGHGIVLAKEVVNSSYECQCHCEENYSGANCEIVSPCRDLECANHGNCAINEQEEAECHCPTKVEIINNAKISGNFCQMIEIPDAVVADSKSCLPCQKSFIEWVECMKVAGIQSKELEHLWKSCLEKDSTCLASLKTSNCFNGGNCTISVDFLPSERLKDALYLTPHCVCEDGFEGEFCEKRKSNPCQVSKEEEKAGMYKCLHGTCSYSPNQGIQCLCDPGFKGARCDVKDPCSPDPCEGALCVEVDPEAPEPKHTCICRLDQEVDSNSMKCETPHHSICRDKAGNPVCLHDGHCYPCALDSEVLNLCSDIETKRGFRCICAPGFLPPFCAKHTDACSFHRCLNGGQCRSMNNSKVDYTCHCKLGFSGNFCEKPMGVCISRGFASCVHGKCQESNSSARGFICECDSGFYGFDCQFEKELAIFEKIDLSWSLGADFAATHFCCSPDPEKTTNIERPRRGSGNGICQRPQRIRRSD